MKDLTAKTQRRKGNKRGVASLRLCGYLLLLAMSVMTGQESYRSTYRVTIEKPAQPAQRAGETSTWRFRVMDAQGTLRTEILREIPFDIAAPAPAVFEDGTVALIHSFDNVVEFFGPDGGLARRVPLSPVPNPEYERVIRHAVHDATLALLISEPSAANCRLVVLNATGDVVRERLLEGIQATGIVIAPDGILVAAGVRSGIRANDEALWLVNGAQDRRLEGGFSTGQFSADGGTFLGRTKMSVMEVDVAKGQRRWEYRVRQGQLVVDAVLAPSGTTILTAESPTLENREWIYRRPVMRIMSAEGVVVNERVVPSVGFRKAKLKPGAGSTEVVCDGVKY
jgi:outer membrane protein assembly factor BamB